ncbi:hypothetical protein VT84_01035 [Gemmata sp. SH-PL17]|uniref:hypothetical protein n=1 Tax=Gemmata sp. SH-PL17 TaxID=1630693 RepID=UPI0004AFF6A3|nr:hypothetical protein [Gemmata sp. SH-PL17]AMV22963.1 hypothetical protein VT84_01035 [Gemmata sp. SH-PL17]
MSIRLSCPSCNTAFTVPAIPDHRRVPCPRCGDVFPVRGELVDQANSTSGETVSERQIVPPAPTVERPKGAPLFAIGLGILLVAGVLGGGIWLAFGTKHKEKSPENAPVPIVAAKPPAELAALGYLRADCNIVFAVQPGPLLDFAARTKQEPREVLARAGLPEGVRNTIEQLGVTLPQIDHVAGGLYLGEGEDALRLALVLVLNQPLTDEAEFLKSLKAKPIAGKKSRHDVVVGRFPLLLTRVSPTVWVFGLDDKDFDAVGRGYGPGGKQFRGGADGQPGVRTMIASVPPDAAIWVAANDERDWTQKPIVKLAGQSPEVKKLLPAVKDGRGGLIAMSFGEHPHLRLRVRTANDAIADRVRAYFTARAAETESATSSGSGAAAQFDAPFDAANNGKLLQRLLNDVER